MPHRSESSPAATPGEPALHAHRPFVLCLIAALLFLARLPYLLIHHLQEDSYMTFRTARNIAEHGDFSFNLHEHFPGTTSLLYPFLVAALDVFLHRFYIVGVQLLGTACVVAASYLAARALSRNARAWIPAWVLLACWPASLLVSYTGMETPVVILALSVAIFAFARGGHPLLFASSIFLLPLLRPDSIAYAVILVAGMWLVDRADGWKGIVALAGGSVVLAIGNFASTGHVITTTMRAKQIAYRPSHAPGAIAERLFTLFLKQSFLLPVSTSYLTRLAPVLLALAIAGFVVAFRRAKLHRDRVLIGVLAVMAFGVPMIYAYGGVIADWYLYPPNWIVAAVCVALVADSLAASRKRVLVYAALGVCWIGMDALQWARSLTASTQDYHYRADIGRYLAEVSRGQGTLLLEPAGYIPYFSGLRTDDEVGLVSGRTTGYMLKYPDHWWLAFVRDTRPDYIVEREYFAQFKTTDGSTMTASEQEWFQQHYRLLRRDHYNPSIYHPQAFLERIWSWGPMPDYLVYQRIQGH